MSLIPLQAALVLASTTGWDTTFEPAATASYLRGATSPVLVVGGGPTNASTQAAVNALAGALRASKQPRFVMTGEALSVQPGDSDATIVKASAVLPVELILVVRTFPGSPETAVVVGYQKDATAVVSLAGVFGQRLEIKSELAPKSNESARSDPLLVPAPVFRGPDERLVVNKRDPSKVTYRGKEISGTELYARLGRTDLEQRYSNGVLVKVLSIIGGIGVGGAGAVTFLISRTGPCAIFDRAASVCLQTQWSSQLSILSAALAVAGAGAIVFGLLFRADPLSDQERSKLVDEYNANLPQQRTETPAVPPVRLAVAPLDAGGVGAVLSLEW